jgi:signal recognition particle receptor subunit beta
VLARLLLGRRKRSSLLLVGSSGAGKTALFSRLTDGSRDGQSTLCATTPSMAENVAALRLGKHGRGAGASRVVDLPGHPRLRSRLDGYAADARGLVFVVDGREGAFLPGVRDVAQCVARLSCLSTLS